jgi:phosphoenolpyruvate carboxykinase (ATP)
MQEVGVRSSRYGIEQYGIHNVNDVFWNLPTSALYEHVVRRREGLLCHEGPLAVTTGHHTGRSPNDRFIVREETSEHQVWWGKVNRPFDPVKFDALYHRLLAYLQMKDLYVQDCFAGADPQYRVPIRILTGTAWHSVFARSLFLRPEKGKTVDHVPEFTVIDVPQFHAVPKLDGTNSEAFIILNLGRRLAIIGGTSYAGEIKKTMFSVMNYLMPQVNVLSMHCSANVGKAGDVAIFFGLSGTGKTTLSADPERHLIGDDEHGWSDHGIFNFEGGCYAKVIRLSAEAEPQIYACTRRFGTILENVTLDTETRMIDLDDDSLTENTRAAYPISHFNGSAPSRVGGHPKNIIMLTCDAFGVMPPISKLTSAQAMYHYLSGYTAKVGGTEKGIGNEPQATFSACFGAPFMTLHPMVYAEMLGDRIAKHGATCWLVNTGWTSGPYGVGQRIKIAYTRAMIRAAVNGDLTQLRFEEDPVFGVHVPTEVPGIPSEILKPRSLWKDGNSYDAKARELAERFARNFEDYGDAPEEVRTSGPRLDLVKS